MKPETSNLSVVGESTLFSTNRNNRSMMSDRMKPKAFGIRCDSTLLPSHNRNMNKNKMYL